MKLRQVITNILESNTRLIPIIGVLVLAIAVPVTLSLIGQSQDNRQQASGPVSVQQSVPTFSCSDISGGECLSENPQQPEFVCFGTVSDGSSTGCATAGEICCVKKNVSIDNSTCTDAGKSCDYGYKDLQECESELGVGNCSIFPDLNCINQNKCFEVATGSATPAPQACPGQCHASESVCEDNNTGKDCVTNASYTCPQTGTTCFDVKRTYVAQGQPCPDGSGNFSCGFGTPDTGCDVCSTTSACTSNNYSIASCSSGQACTGPQDCAGLPSSCPAGTTGSVACIQNICQTVNCQ